MKAWIIGVAVVLFSTPALAGHYNQQIWRFYTENCDQVASGATCTEKALEVSTSTWCGSSCSWSEKTDTFHKAMNALQSYYDLYLRPNGFREKITPLCSSYLNCYSAYSGGYSDGETSVWSFGDWSTGSRQDFAVRELYSWTMTKQ
jgi:hypothetical protein